MLHLALALALSSPQIGTFALPGNLHDVFELPTSGLVATFSDGQGRGLRTFSASGFGKRQPVPNDALLVDGCAKGVVFAKPNGLFDQSGNALIGGQAIFPTADAASLFEANESALQIATSFSDAGFLAPLHEGEWTFHVDTSVLAMGKVLMTQTLPLSLRNAAQQDVLSLSIDADLSRSRINGSFPRAGFDVDGDGTKDLIDLGRNKQVRIFRGKGKGFEKSPFVEEKVSPFSRVWAFNKGLVLVGKKLTFINLSHSELTQPSPRRR